MQTTVNDDLQPDEEPMTEAQRIYLDTLAAQAGEPTPENDLTKDEASEAINQLRRETGINDTIDITTGEDPTLNRDR